MKYAVSQIRFLFLSFLCLAFPTLALSQPKPKEVRVRVPQEMATKDLTISYGLYGKGLFMSEIRGKSGVSEYTVPFRDDASTLTMLAYCPGYAVVHASQPPFAEVWAPDFQKLPTTQLKGKLTDSKGGPLPGEKLILRYAMIEAMSFFGYIDGSCPTLAMATVETQQDGTFEATIPALEKDPFLQKDSQKGYKRQLEVALARNEADQDALRNLWDLRPIRIPMQSENSPPVVLQVVKKARLQGQIAPAILKTNGFEGVVNNYGWAKDDTSYHIQMHAKPSNGQTRFYCFLKKDLSFSAPLPPGTYDLLLTEVGRDSVVHKTLTVKEGVTLEEGGEANLRIE